MIRIVRVVINEELIDQDQHLHQYPPHLHLRHHHQLDQMILFDEKVQQQIHVIVIQDENMILNDDLIIITDEQDHDQEDGEFKNDFSSEIIFY
jgi:hypothetical protein